MKRIYTLFVFISCVAFANAQVTNKAVSFNGTATSKVSFGNLAEVNGVSRFTFEAWVYIDQWKENSYIFSKSAAVANRIDIQLGPVANRRLYFHVSNNGNAYAAVDNSALAEGSWHHIAMAYNGTGAAYQMIEIFIDGAKATPWYSSGNGTLPATTPTTAASFELGTNGFAGKLDEVRLWNTNLTLGQLDFHNTINSYHPLYNNLVAYWKMEQNNSAIVDDKSGHHGVASNASLIEVTDNPAFKYRIVSSYIRSNQYENGAVSEQSLLNNNDIIELTANPYADGSLFFEYPINDGTLANATYLSSFDGRNGVLDLNGAGAAMNAGQNLLNTATAGVKTFTFATWVYLDNWNENSYIFRKQSNANNTIDLQLGASATSTLLFHLSNGNITLGTISLNNSGLTTGQWHHVAVTYNGNGGANNQVKIYVDGVSKTGFVYSSGNGTVPTSGPFIRADFELGVNFDGKLDETVMNLLSLSAGEITGLKNNGHVLNGFNSTKANAYWKYDDPAAPGKDSRTWVRVFNSLKNSFSDRTGAKIRFGLSGGAWQAMVGNAAARTNFANQVKAVIQTFGFDGVDLDFEWAANTTEWANYSAAIVELKNALPADKRFTVSLHPIYYKISAAAIAAVDYISMQCYGPNPARFPYDQFVTDVNTVLSYGIPKNKLVMGMPFYATTSNNTGTTSYSNIVAVYPNLDPDLDQVPFVMGGVQKTAVFNGQTTIAKKTLYTRELDLAGMMTWDLSTDIAMTNNLALQRSMNGIMNANVDLVSNASIVIQSQTINFGSLPQKVMGEADFDLTATATSGLPVSYTSSNPAVAEIVNGKVHITGVGTAVITASQAGDDRYISAPDVSRELTVVADTEPPVLTSPDDITLCYQAIGNYTVPALVAEDKSAIGTITYVITGATTRNGEGLDASGNFNPGVSSIAWTVTDKYGNSSNASVTVTINQQLKAAIADVYAVNPGGDANTIYLGYVPSSLTYNVAVAGGTAPYLYAWANGSTTASADVNPLAAGSYIYSVVVTDALGCNLTIAKQVRVTDARCGNDKVQICHAAAGNHTNDLCISINAVSDHLAHGCKLGACNTPTASAASMQQAQTTNLQTDAFAIRVYPNPTATEFSLRIAGSEHPVNVKVFDIQGRLLKTMRTTTGTLHFGKELKAGTYLVEVTQDKNRWMQKLVKQSSGL